MQKIKGLIVALLFLTLGVSGCASTMSAIQNKDMSVSLKMSDTIFLDPEVIAKSNSIYVRVTNTSDFQEINFADFLRDKLVSRGMTVINDPSKAGYTLQANVLYMGQAKKDMTADGMLAGGVGGALIGGNRNNVGGGLIGGIAGAVIGGLIASAIHVDTYYGVVDIQIKETSAAAVRGSEVSEIRNGSSSTIQTERAINSNRQEYRTRLVVQARQTNIDRTEAVNAISNKLASQIAGVF